MIFELSDLKRRLENLIRVGKVAHADYEGARVRVRIGNLVTQWLPWVTHRAKGGESSWWAPELGEQVIVFSPSGETALGFVLPAIYQSGSEAKASSADKARVDFGNGSYVEHDRSTGRLRVYVPGGGLVAVESGGDVEILAAQDVRITAAQTLSLEAAQINIDGPITHTGGDITSTGNFTTPEEVEADGIKLSAHKHTGVLSGGAQTGNPV